jgi:hypothetical protein
MNLSDWLPPLVASLLGAGVGALALLLVYRAERANRRDERFEEAFSALLAAMLDQSERQVLYLEENGLIPTASARARSMKKIPEPPSDAGLNARLQVAKMLGNKVERELLQQLAAVITFNRQEDLTHYSGILSAAATEFALWHVGDVPVERVREDFKSMEDDAHRIQHERAVAFAKLQSDLQAASETGNV